MRWEKQTSSRGVERDEVVDTAAADREGGGDRGRLAVAAGSVLCRR